MSDIQLATPEDIARFAASFQSYLDAYGGGSNRADSGPPSSSELWLDHFMAVRIHDDPQLHAMAERHDIDTAMFSQLLEAVLSKTYDKPYARLRAREIVPEGPPINQGAETVATFGFDSVGSAKVLAGYGEDIPLVDLYGKKAIRNIVGVAAKWAITLQQARAAAMAAIDIDGKGLNAAKRMIDRKIDDLIADGDADHGIDGFFSLAVDGSAVLYENKAGNLTGDWDTATVANVEADIAICLANFDSDDLYEPSDLVLDTSTYSRWKTKRLDATSHTTMLEYFADKYDFNIHKWKKADSSAPSSAKRCVFFAREEDVISSIVSQEPEQLPSVWQGIRWETVMHARCGGIRSENPRGMLYADHET